MQLFADDAHYPHRFQAVGGGDGWGQTVDASLYELSDEPVVDVPESARQIAESVGERARCDLCGLSEGGDADSPRGLAHPVVGCEYLALHVYLDQTFGSPQLQ